MPLCERSVCARHEHGRRLRPRDDEARVKEKDTDG